MQFSDGTDNIFYKQVLIKLPIHLFGWTVCYDIQGTSKFCHNNRNDEKKFKKLDYTLIWT